MFTANRFMHRLWLLTLCGVMLGTLCCVSGCGKKAAANNPLVGMPVVDFQSKVPQMKDGMTYNEMVALLGGVQGKDVTMPPAANAPESSKGIKAYQWVDADKNMLMCNFKDDKLVFKIVDTTFFKTPPAAK